MRDKLIGVTGVSGVVGGAVFRLLDRHDYPVRGFVRSANKAPFATGSRGEVGILSYGAAGARLALQDVDVLFMVAADESEARLALHGSVIAAAKEAGVEHVVYASYMGASADPEQTLGYDHLKSEELLRSSGMGWTILRSSFYADVFEDYARPDCAFRGPAGDGRVSLVSRADVARCAAAVLINYRKHHGKVYQLTGPEALSLDDVAAALTKARGKTYRYCSESVEEARQWRRARALTQWQVDAWISIYLTIAEGKVSAVTGDVETLTGAAPLSYARVLRHSPLADPGADVLIPGMAALD